MYVVALRPTNIQPTSSNSRTKDSPRVTMKMLNQCQKRRIVFLERRRRRRPMNALDSGRTVPFRKHPSRTDFSSLKSLVVIQSWVPILYVDSLTLPATLEEAHVLYNPPLSADVCKYLCSVQPHATMMIIRKPQTRTIYVNLEQHSCVNPPTRG